MSKHLPPQLFTLAVILCLLLSAPSAFAEGGDGSGGGQNRNIPFTLETTSIQDGETQVSLTPTIQLDFNKNICNIAVLPNNKKCFHLTEDSGKAVAINLIFPDDQVQQTYKRQVFIQPGKKLKPDTRYRMTVDRTLTAKNGMAIDNAYTIHFTTGTDAAKEPNAVLKKLGENVLTYESALSETADSAPVNKQSLDKDRQDEGLSTKAIAKIAGTVIILILLLSTIFLILRRRRK